jgi:HAD superfamily phosphatase (TIGR01668 family)
MKSLLTPDACVNSIFNITPEGLSKRGIYGLILDIDNTLVATNKDADRKVFDYIAVLKDHGIKAIIVSNARKKRVELFCTPLHIDYVYKAHKPLRKGFDLAYKKLGLPKEQIAIIGDQLFTDVLGGKLAGINTILLKPIDMDEPVFIKLKRVFERPFISNKHFTDKY